MSLLWFRINGRIFRLSATFNLFSKLSDATYTGNQLLAKDRNILLCVCVCVRERERKSVREKICECNALGIVSEMVNPYTNEIFFFRKLITKK